MALSPTQLWLQSALRSYQLPELTYSHVNEALGLFPSLGVKTDQYIFNDGRTVVLLCQHGTIPISFKGARYNIPLAIWFPLTYPREPPMVFVTPTSGMLVRQSREVDPSGRTVVPYLEGWARKWESCDLYTLLGSLQETFSRQPPVVAKPKTNADLSTPPKPTPSPAAFPRQSSPSYPSSIYNSSGAPTKPSPIPPHETHPSYSRAGPPPPGYPSQPPPPPVSQLPLLSSSPSPSVNANKSPPPPPIPPMPHQPTVGPNNGSPLVPPAVSPYQQQKYGSPQPDRNSFYQQQPQYGYHSSSTPHHHLPHDMGSPPPPPLPPTPALPFQAAASIQTPFGPAGPSPAPPPLPPNPELVRLHSDVHSLLSNTVSSTLQGLDQSNAALSSIKADLDSGEVAIVDETQRLIAVRDVCLNVRDRVGSTVQEGERRISLLNERGEVSVEEVVCSSTIVYNQLIDLVAESAALSDTLYQLSRALNAEKIDLDKFLRMSRVVGAEMFLKRCLAEKILNGGATPPP